MNELIVKVNEFTLPTIKWNRDEIKQEIETIVKPYKGLVLKEKDVAQAKKVKAELNKVAKDLNDRKIQVKKAWNKEYTTFENELKELMGTVTTVSDDIKEQINDFEEKEKAQKRYEIEALDAWAVMQDYIPFDEKWLNKSVTMKSIQEELGSQLASIEADKNTIKITAANINMEADKYIEMLKKMELQAVIERMYEDNELLTSQPKEEAPEPVKVDKYAKVLTAVRVLKGTAEQLASLKAYADKIGVTIEKVVE